MAQDSSRASKGRTSLKKFKNLVIGGIENKIFNLILITGILITAAFIAVTAYQYNTLVNLTTETNGRQQTTMTAMMDELMDQVVNNTLSQRTELEAYIADEMFGDLAAQVMMLEEYAGKLIRGEIEVSPAAYATPDPAKDGVTTAQLILKRGVNAGSLKEKLGLVANMSELMISLFDMSEQTNSCFIALPEGALLVADDRSAGKFKADGSLTNFDPQSRPWFWQASLAGRLVFSDVETDSFTGDIGVVCAAPVYDANGKLAAVVGCDLFLTSMQQAVQASDEYGGFICVINQYGHVVFSPKTEGSFQVVKGSRAEDLRESENTELASLVRDAAAQKTDVRKVTADEQKYYMVGAPIGSIGWTLINIFSAEVAQQPAVMMRESYTTIADEAAATYQESIGHSRTMIMVLLGILTVLLIGAALVLGKRIVRPLNRITKRIAEISETSPEFKMEDQYRTGDEIEVLAESFAELSHKTVEYVKQVARVTAEKERINSELMMAKEIQSSQLPRIFPPFPNNPSFDLYASMTPAKEVGGDFYDFFLIDNDHLAMVMADVSGKGVPAALFMMIAKTLIKNRLQSGETLSNVLANVNHQLLEGNEAGMFVTAWVGVLQLSTGDGIAVNAGHEHPAIRRAGGEWELVKYRHSLALATIEEAKFKEHTFHLGAGDSLFVYTDGVMEATSAEEELMGEERTLAALNRDPGAAPDIVLKNVMDGINTFVAGAEQFDDITMLCLRYNGIIGA